MNLADLSNDILSYIITYGAVALGVVVFLTAIGVPLPGTFFVIASGAFVQQGFLELYSTLGIALTCVVIGDLTSYGLGRALRQGLLRRYGETKTWNSAISYFNRRGDLSIYFTRWLITPIALPINLVSGSSGYALPRFASFAAAGELTWLLLYGTLGYLFGSQWEVVSDFASDFSGVIVGVVVVGIGGYWLFRQWRRTKEASAE